MNAVYEFSLSLRERVRVRVLFLPLIPSFSPREKEINKARTRLPVGKFAANGASRLYGRDKKRRAKTLKNRGPGFETGPRTLRTFTP
jgi:hypothetical protein